MTDRRMQDQREEFSDLIVAVGRRDRAAFETLFDYFAPRIKTMMLRTGMAEQRADDVAQDSMLLVWRKAALFDPAGAGPSAWIFTIARNVRIDALRREKRRQRTAIELSLQPESQSSETDADLIAAQSEEIARSCMIRLSDEQRTVVRLSFFDGKAHSEIAETLGIPLGTVKSRLRLALKHLRTMLEDTQ